MRIGERVKVKMKGSKKKEKTATYEGLIEFIHDRFITVNTGEYRITILKADLCCGDAAIKVVGE